MVLNVKDLCRDSLKRYQNDVQIYKTLIYELSEKINKRHREGKYNLVYRVPRLIIGNHRYDSAHASYYIMKEFIKGGFIVIPSEQNNLYIDWSVVKKLMFSKKKEVTFCLDK
tara:strand:- start:7069 stop:7404 length:336 start_codon:yes stop_codon:yes gene_type:complete